MIALPLTALSFWAGWTEQLVTRLPGDVGLWGNLIVFGASAVTITAVRASLHNRIQIEQVTAGAATISLTNKSGTYFDDYLDEIVYFFEKSRKSIVILEDIDRFDDPYIFETLRSLNTLLNGARQLRHRRIVFVYAIKDSIFDELGRSSGQPFRARSGDPHSSPDAADAELARANRTKFFDLVIPVVPFITHRSARDLLTQTLSDVHHHISPELIDLTARHVADMRLIKNVRNEFAVFRHEVFERGSLDLREDALFAMVLYKSTHLTDFELVRYGKSDVDRLYALGRSLVARNIEKINAQIRLNREELRVSAPPTNPYAWGTRLWNYVQGVLRQLGPIRQESVTFDGETLTLENVRAGIFWERVASADLPVSITWASPFTGYQTSLTLDRAEMANVVGDSLRTEDWRITKRSQLLATNQRLAADRSWLTHADMAQLVERSDFTIELDGETVSFEQAVRTLLGSDLARSLLIGGYLDRNFTLYTSTFYAERVTVGATNFIIKNVDPNITDMAVRLTRRDAEGVMLERGASLLNQRSALNFSLLDHLVDHDRRGASELLLQVALDKEGAREFILGYMEQGERRVQAVELLGGWEHLLVFLVEESGVGDDDRLDLVNAALLHLRSDNDYEATHAVVEYLTSSYDKFRAFTDDEAPADALEAVQDILSNAGAAIPSLAALSAGMRAHTLARRTYVVNRENLTIALGGGQPQLELDQVKSANPDVYARVLSELSSYFRLLGTAECAVGSAGDLAGVLTDAEEVDPSSIAEIVVRSDPGSSVRDLATAPLASWQVLAENGRIIPTFLNVAKYVDANGVDVAIGSLLQDAGEILPSDGQEEAVKVGIAEQLLNAAETIPPPASRAALASSLQLAEYLSAARVVQMTGELLASLLAEGLVPDSSESFASVVSGECSGRAAAIGQSASFQQFMTPELVPEACIPVVMEDETVDARVKQVIVTRSSEFAIGPNVAAAGAVLAYATATGQEVPLSEVIRLAVPGQRTSLVVRALRPHLATASFEELAPLLTRIGGEYLKLTQARKRPTLPDTEADRELVDRMESLGLVSSKEVSGGQIRVHMRRMSRFWQ